MNDAPDTLRLARHNRWLLGVCGGLADWVGMPAWLVRLGFIVATFTWGLTLLVYPALYLVMDRGGRRSRQQNGPLRKDKQRGKLAGVCAGLARRLDIEPIWVRLAVLGSLMFGPFAIFGYVLAAVVMDRDDERDFFTEGHATSSAPGVERLPKAKVQRLEIHALEQTFAKVETRLRKIETAVTSREFALKQKFKQL